MFIFGTLGGGEGLLAGLRMGSGRSAAGGPYAKPLVYLCVVVLLLIISLMVVDSCILAQ